MTRRAGPGLLLGIVMSVGISLAADDAWSRPGRSLVELAAVEGRASLEVTLRGKQDTMPNPAGCPDAYGFQLRPGAPDDQSQKVVYGEVPLLAATPSEELRLRLITDALYSAHVSRASIQILLDGTRCSESGRPIIKGVRLQDMNDPRASEDRL